MYEDNFSFCFNNLQYCNHYLMSYYTSTLSATIQHHCY